MPILKGVPDWALYAGGGIVVGGGYLLYKKHKAAAATTSSGTPATTSSYTDQSASGQQPSIVPYYLTGGRGSTSYPNGSTITQGAPLPTPSGPPGGSNVDTSGATLPSIPPLLPNVNTTTSVPQPSTPTPTAPSQPTQQVANLPADVVSKINSNGEQLVGNLIDPLTGGTWWFGSKGGVFSVNGARFLGSVPSVGAYFPGLSIIQARPSGTGYQLSGSKGEVYNFPG